MLLITTAPAPTIEFDPIFSTPVFMIAPFPIVTLFPIFTYAPIADVMDIKQPFPILT